MKKSCEITFWGRLLNVKIFVALMPKKFVVKQLWLKNIQHAIETR